MTPGTALYLQGVDADESGRSVVLPRPEPARGAESQGAGTPGTQPAPPSAPQPHPADPPHRPTQALLILPPPAWNLSLCSRD